MNTTLTASPPSHDAGGFSAGCYHLDMSDHWQEEPATHDVATLGDDGSLTLPEELRARLGWAAGDRLALTLEAEDTLRVTSLRREVERARGLYAGLSAGESLADELIAERRQEARSEETEE